MSDVLPDPAVLVLVGASGSGKSTWARARYRSQEIVSSDDLRGVVGSGSHDLEASGDAFHLLDQIVAGRTRRGLMTVVDTLGLDRERRIRYLAAARSAGLPAVVVVFDTPTGRCRARNAERDRPVPAAALTEQLRKARSVTEALAEEGWDQVVRVDSEDQPAPAVTAVRATGGPGPTGDLVLQISRFPWGEDPVGWLRAMAVAAAEAGFGGIALMDHLIQIPQVERAWSPIPEPFTTLGMLAGLDTQLRLGTLCTPATFRSPGILAKAFATLDVLSGGRAFCGLGAGWWQREHEAFGVPFPPIAERLDQVETAIETMRALWASGTKGYDGHRVQLPETTCYPRPVAPIPIIVGGGGERRTLRVVARLADGCNLPSDEVALAHKREVLRRHCEEAGRDPDEVAVTVLDLPVIGDDREDTWARVERLRGRTAAATFAQRHHAGTVERQRSRLARLRESGISTIFMAPLDLEGPEDVLRLAPLTQ